MAHTGESLQAAFKYLFPAEVPALKELVRSLPRNPAIVNIGAGSGTSALAIMEARHDVFLRTVDIQLEDSPFGCLIAEQRIIDEAGYGNVNGMGQRYLQVHSDSKVYGKEFSDAGFKVDMVFIDGDHSYEGCTGDIQAWLPNIKPGGIIAVHDYKKHLLTYNEETCPHPRPWPGVDRAVDELLLMGGYEMVMYVESLIAFRIPG